MKNPPTTATEIHHQMETEIRAIAASLLAAYSSNPNMHPTDEFTLGDLRAMAIAQARLFYAEAMKKEEKPAPVAKGIIVRIIGKSSPPMPTWIPTLDGEMKIMDGDENTRIYLQNLIENLRKLTGPEQYRLEGTVIGQQVNWKPVDERRLWNGAGEDALCEE